MRALSAMAVALLVAALAGAVGHAQEAVAPGSRALLVEIRDAIGPATKEHFLGALERAQSDGFEVLVLVLDTPGGLDAAMRDIIQGILNARIPVFRPFPLRKIENINSQHLKSLEREGIKETGALLLAGRTKVMRRELAHKTEIPESDLEYLLKLADLMRMPGVKNIRAKLYIDAGIDCVAKFATQQPDQMRVFMFEFVKKTKTTRTAPLPKEIATGIAWAKILPVVVIF